MKSKGKWVSCVCGWRGRRVAAGGSCPRVACGEPLRADLPRGRPPKPAAERRIQLRIRVLETTITALGGPSEAARKIAEIVEGSTPHPRTGLPRYSGPPLSGVRVPARACAHALVTRAEALLPDPAPHLEMINVDVVCSTCGGTRVVRGSEGVEPCPVCAPTYDWLARTLRAED